MRLMKINYKNKNDVERLKTCFDMCAIRYIIFKEYEFVDGTALYSIFIDKNICKWADVIREINRVHPVKMKYLNNLEIKDGKLYEIINAQNFYPSANRILN